MAQKLAQKVAQNRNQNRPEVPFEKDTCVSFLFWIFWVPFWALFGPFLLLQFRSQFYWARNGPKIGPKSGPKTGPKIGPRLPGEGERRLALVPHLVGERLEVRGVVVGVAHVLRQPPQVPNGHRQPIPSHVDL